MDLRERVGHTLVVGTTRVGKTRLEELLVTQDIRRGNITIVFDPKGDADLLKRMWAEAHRAGRQDDFHVFHLGWPEISARYNAVGRFGRVSEVASRIAGQLGAEGNSAAFREFAWRFVNIVTRALVALGQRPDYSLIMLRVRENRTAELLTSQLPEVDVYSKTLVSGYTDITNQEQGTDFTSNTQDRVSMVKTPMLTPADIINLPKGQAFALLEGGQLWKIRMPLPAADKTDLMPESLQKIAAEMRRNYRTSEAWWSGADGAEQPGGE